MAKKGEYNIVDTMDYLVPESMVQDAKKEYKLLRDSENTKYLEIEVDVTHGGYVNRNFYYYEPDGQARGVASFFTPYPKPVLAQHISTDTPVGRTYAAAYIPLPVEDTEDLKKPKSKIRVKSVITDQRAIEYILDARYLTVSSGGSANDPPKCSVCNEPIESIGPLGSVAGCDHRRGQTYELEDGVKKLCFWKIGAMDYKEYSFVNMPADHTPSHVASVVGFRFVDPSVVQNTSSSVSVDNAGIEELNKSTDSEISDSTDGKNDINDQNTDTGGNDMAEDKTKQIKSDSDVDLLALFALELGDDCKECEEWTDATEDETKEGAAMEEDLINIYEMIFGDRVLPKAGSKERQAMKGKFCGPNKTFPIPDCKHAGVALAMLNWPRVKAKYSDSVRARIASCVRGRAKTLGCKMSKKNDNADLQTQFDKVTEEINTLKADVQTKDAEIKKANDKIEELTANVKKQMAEKVVDLSMMSERNSVKEIMAEKDAEERTKKYEEMVEDLSKRTFESLNDSIKDLGGEVSFKIDDARIDDPTIKTEDKSNDKEENKDKSEVKSVAEKVFNV